VSFKFSWTAISVLRNPRSSSARIARARTGSSGMPLGLPSEDKDSDRRSGDLLYAAGNSWTRLALRFSHDFFSLQARHHSIGHNAVEADAPSILPFASEISEPYSAPNRCP